MEDGLKIKICGMRDTENIRQVITLRPDFIGFILHPLSPRYIGKDYRIETAIPPEIKRVGVFVNSLIGDIIHWINTLELDYVQLHGVEPVEYCRELKEMNIRVIKAFGIDEDFDFSMTEAYIPFCDYFLFDSKSPLHGGSGKKFPWTRLEDLNIQHQVILSGGIGPDDTKEIYSLNKKIKISALDINSRFEISPGIKNVDLLKNFINQIKNR